jgi:acetyl esterase
MPTKRIYDPSVEALAAMFPRYDFADADAIRAAAKAMKEAAAAKGVMRPTDPRVEEIERTVPGPVGAPDLLIRIYRPLDRGGVGPGYVSFHGGGFIAGDLETDHVRCLLMAAEGSAVCVTVAYRLAPENPFPAGVEDCYAALQWAVGNSAALEIDPARVAIGGGSAGGCLAAAVALMARDRGGPAVAFQMLFYPVLDDRCETSSMRNGADLYVWTPQQAADSWAHYLGKERSHVSPYAAPARAEDLSGLPPAFVLTCEHDPLRDEGILYAMRLMEAGVPVELHNYPGTVHAFDGMPTEVSARALREGVQAFRRALAH